jgi:hypothetical protein
MEVGALRAPEPVMGLDPIAVPALLSSVMELPLKLATHALPDESLAMAIGADMPPLLNGEPEAGDPLLVSSTTLLPPVFAIQALPLRSMEMPRGASRPPAL